MVIERSAVTPQDGSGISPIASDVLNQEVARIEQLQEEITKLIDDPATALSTVMRKNVERSEFNAYLQGIRFVIGKGARK